MLNNANWRVVHYETADGTCPVGEFLDGLTVKERAKVLAAIDLLEEEGPDLHRPYADTLKDGIHELRIKLSGNQIRILYFFCYENFIILTNSFSKNKKRVPEKEINKAKEYRTDFLKRYPENKLRREYNENI